MVPLPEFVKAPLAESLLITKLPVRVPAAAGEKVTVIVQFAARSKVLPHVVDLAKSPLMLMPLMLRISPPALVSVNVRALLAPMLVLLKKLPKPDGGVAPIEPVRDATAPCPDPLRLIVCGLPGALLVMVSVPVRAPVAVGLKLTFSAQNPATPKPLPQLFVTEKSPVVTMLLMANAAVPVLVKLTLCAVLVLPLFSKAKFSLVGRPLTNPVTLKEAVTAFAASMVTVQVAAFPELAHAPPQAIRLATGLADKVTTSSAK